MQIDMSIEAISIRLNEEFGIDAAINGYVQGDHRLMVFLENSRMAVIATDDEGISMMRDERSVLQALGDRTSFEVPKSLKFQMTHLSTSALPSSAILNMATSSTKQKHHQNWP